MKRTISLILALVMCLSLCACGSSASTNDTNPTSTKEENNATESTSQNAIELTTENIAEYLVIKYHYSDKEVASIGSFATATVTIEIYPVAGGSFNNVKLILNSSIGNHWKVAESDSSYKYLSTLTAEWSDDSWQEMLITEIQLPADGKYTETHTIQGNSGMELPADKDMTWFSHHSEGVNKYAASTYLEEGTPYVTGTFIPN